MDKTNLQIRLEADGWLCISYTFVDTKGYPKTVETGIHESALNEPERLVFVLDMLIARIKAKIS